MSLVVIYDACVLYPAPLRDLLMHLAMAGIYQAKWTEQIHDEWIRNVLASRPDLTSEILERTKKLMDLHAGDCLVINYEDLIPSLDLPDDNDRHVLAAAIRASASLIITYNLKDFPLIVLNKYQIEAQDPDQFILRLLDLSLNKVLQAVKLHRSSLKNPPKTVNEYLETLQKQKLYQTVERLQNSAHEL
jgi:hypothetical protein